MPSNFYLMWKYFLAFCEGQPRYRVLLLLWRGLQSLQAWEGPFWETPMEQKGRVKVSHGKERGVLLPWRKTDFSLRASPQVCLGSSSVLTQSARADNVGEFSVDPFCKVFQHKDIYSMVHTGTLRFLGAAKDLIDIAAPTCCFAH